MGILVEYNESLGVVLGKVKGGLTKEIAVNYFLKMAEAGSKYNSTLLLSDLRKAHLLADIEDMKCLSAGLAEIGLDRRFKRALLVTEDVKKYKEWENHCFSHGYEQIRLFMEEEAAIAWLKSDSHAFEK